MTGLKLYAGLRAIKHADLVDLANVEYLAELLRRVGLEPDSRPIYGEEGIYMNPERGLWQLPCEFAGMLAFLSRFSLRNILDIGTYRGWTVAVMTAYLHRWNPELRVTTLDPYCLCDETELLGSILPIQFSHETSAAYSGQSFDFCFIDGDHTFNQVRSDYEHVGRHAQICGFHDINDAYVEEGCTEGGVPAFWRSLCRAEREIADFHEFVQYPVGKRIMGIGLRVQRTEGA
jgi:hypothetical protein